LKVMEVLRALPDFSAKFSGSVSSEIKRLHRAIVMSTCEIVMAHNVAAGGHRESTIPEFLAGADPAIEASLFQESLEGPPPVGTPTDVDWPAISAGQDQLMGVVTGGC